VRSPGPPSAASREGISGGPLLDGEQMLEPDQRRAGNRRHPSDRQQHAGHERLAVDRVVADRERLADLAQDHLLVGHEPGQAHRVDRDLGCAAGLGARFSHQRGRARRGAARLVELAIVMELDDLGFGHVPGRLGGEPHHQHRADGEVRRDEYVGAGAGDIVQLGRVEAGGPDHHVNAGGHRRPRVLHHGGGDGEVDQHVGGFENIV
jgi:hypothetical protein